METQKQRLGYTKVSAVIRERISAGKYQPGTLFPGRRALASEFGLPPRTIERAVNALVAQGLLRTEDRRGTFVSESALAILGSGEPDRVEASPDAFRPFTVGLVTPAIVGDPREPQNANGSELVNAFERFVSARNGTTRQFGPKQTDGTGFDVVAAARDAIAAECDGLLVARHFKKAEAVEVFRLAAAAGITAVFAGARSELGASFFLDHPAPFAVYEHVDAGLVAAEHLLRKGLRKLLYFSVYPVDWAQERLEGVLKAARTVDGAVVSVEIRDVAMPDIARFRSALDARNYDMAASYEAGKRLVASGIRGMGVIAANDFMATGFIRAAEEAGLHAGQDYAIVGFDDDYLARPLDLSTVQPPWEAMGREAGRLMIEGISTTGPYSESVVVRPTLIARGSSLLKSDSSSSEIASLAP